MQQRVLKTHPLWQRLARTASAALRTHHAAAATRPRHARNPRARIATAHLRARTCGVPPCMPPSGSTSRPRRLSSRSNRCCPPSVTLAPTWMASNCSAAASSGGSAGAGAVQLATRDRATSSSCETRMRACMCACTSTSRTRHDVARAQLHHASPLLLLQQLRVAGAYAVPRSLHQLGVLLQRQHMAAGRCQQAQQRSGVAAAWLSGTQRVQGAARVGVPATKSCCC